MIVVCGEALVDMTPARVGEGEGYLPRPGGSPYNVAVALSRLDVPVAFLGRVSTDAFGRLLRQHLVGNGVDLRYLREGPELSTLAFVHLAGAEPEFTFYGEGAADRQLRPEDLPAAFPQDVLAIHCGSISLALEPIASTLDGLMRRERKKRLISLDPNVRPGLIRNREAYRERLEEWVASADLVKVSRADLSWLYPQDPIDHTAERWRGMGPAFVVVTLGERGAQGFGRHGVVRVPGIPVRVVDTVGAGDAFTAGLLAWLFHHGRLTPGDVERLPEAELVRALDYANRVAALTSTRRGADPPRRQEVESAE